MVPPVAPHQCVDRQGLMASGKVRPQLALGTDGLLSASLREVSPVLLGNLAPSIQMSAVNVGASVPSRRRRL